MPHIVFFSAWCCAAAPVAYYYYRRNPHPRFRPSMGEMTLVSVLLLAAGGGGSYALGGLFRGNLSMKSFKAKPNEGAGMEAGKHGEVKPTRDDSDDGEPKEREMKSFDK